MAGAHAALESLDKALSQLAEESECDPLSLGDAQSVIALHQMLSRLESLVTASVSSFDRSCAYADDGAKTAAAWMARSCRVPKREAKRRVAHGRALRDLPVSKEAFSRGEITSSHVSAISRLRRPATEAALERDEKLLVESAKELRFDQFEKALSYWEQMADEDGAERSFEEKEAARGAFLVKSFGDAWLGKMNFGPLSGAIVSEEVERLERELFECDWREAKRRLGRDPRPTELYRTPPQRRADAIVEMATRSKTADAGARRPAPLFTVLVDYETIHGRMCELADGTVLPPGSLLRWLEPAYVERAVFGPGKRVEIGETTRFFTGPTRRAVEIRDRECVHDFCDVPAKWCQVDHEKPWSEGGTTVQENGRLLCGFHNRSRHRPPPGADP